MTVEAGMSTSPIAPGAAVAVRTATAADLDGATEVLVRAFVEEPGNVALLPDPETREAMVRVVVGPELKGAMRYGTVHVATVDGQVAGVAVWHPPGAPAVTLGTLLRTAIGTLVDPRAYLRSLPHKSSVLLRSAPQVLPLALARHRGVRRASTGVSWHLAFLATAPEHRGAGLARRLLDRQLGRCDEDGAAAWLETTDPVNPPIYERFGFATVVHLDRAAWLPGFWVMRREPAGSVR